MSIITDALRKAEHDRIKAKQRIEAEAASVAVIDELVSEQEILEPILSISRTEIQKEKLTPRAPKARVRNPEVSKYMVVIIASAVILICFFILSFIPKKTVLIVQDQKVISDQKERHVLAENQVVPDIKYSKPRSYPYVLSGISKLGETTYAIINGVIVQEGDSIDGAHIDDIIAREVTLKTKLGKIKLQIQ